MPVIVGWIITALMTVFKSRIGQIIIAALAWAGLTWGTQKVLVTPIVNSLWGYLDSLNSVAGQYGAPVLQGLGMLKIDIAMTMIVSAVATKAAMGAARTFMQPKAVGGGTGF
jgi:hypothetical protein